MSKPIRSLANIRLRLSRISLHSRVGVRLILAGTFLILLTLLIGIQSTTLTSFPKGYDTMGHMALSGIIKDNFPYVLWNPYWDEGTPLLYRNYAPLYHFSVGLLSRAFNWDIVPVTFWFLGISVGLAALSIFGVVYYLTNRILPALFAGMVFLASSTLWYSIVVNGLYVRVLTMGILGLALLSLVVYLEKTNWTNWRYYAVVFSFTLAFLTHFLAVVLLIFSSFILIWATEKSPKKILKRLLSIFLPVVGLSAFYYLPAVLGHSGGFGLFGEFGGQEYTPLNFLSLFRQGYPGLPFLALPLGLVLFILVYLLRFKLKNDARRTYKYFLAFGLLSALCLFYVLGFYKLFFSGIYPGHFLLPTVFFLAIFLGLGLAFLIYCGIVKTYLVIVLLVGLLAIGLQQTIHLKKLASDPTGNYPAINFKKIDQEKNFRFAHVEEALGGAFNFYSKTLQAGGYYGQGILNPDAHFWFETGVFETQNNQEETRFLLDWFGVSGFYLGNRARGGRAVKSWGKFGTWQDFEQEGQEVGYLKAKPILLATNAPVVLSRKEGRQYLFFLKDLAKEGLDSRFVIPVKDRWAGAGEFSTEVVETPLRPFDFAQGFAGQGGKEAKFVNSQRRELVLEEKFSGVVFKESYFRNWRAYLVTNREPAATENTETERITRNLKIYYAGPGMMYVSLPKDYPLPAKVVFEYKMGELEWAGVGVSILTFLALIFASNRQLYKRIGSLISTNFKLQIRRCPAKNHLS